MLKALQSLYSLQVAGDFAGMRERVIGKQQRVGRDFGEKQGELGRRAAAGGIEEDAIEVATQARDKLRGVTAAQIDQSAQAGPAPIGRSQAVFARLSVNADPRPRS